AAPPPAEPPPPPHPPAFRFLPGERSLSGWGVEPPREQAVSANLRGERDAVRLDARQLLRQLMRDVLRRLECVDVDDELVRTKQAIGGATDFEVRPVTSFERLDQDEEDVGKGRRHGAHIEFAGRPAVARLALAVLRP